MDKVTLITRRRLDYVAEEYNVDLNTEEEKGRLVQHVEGEELIMLQPSINTIIRIPLVLWPLHIPGIWVGGGGAGAVFV